MISRLSRRVDVAMNPALGCPNHLHVTRRPARLDSTRRADSPVVGTSRLTEPTRLLYLEDSQRMTSWATWTRSGSDPRGPYVVFNQTIFHPQGGGQPADRGHFTLDGVSYAVQHVALNREFSAEVRHYVQENVAQPPALRHAELHLDSSFRRRASFLHSGGHLIADILMELYPSIIQPRKNGGYHFPDNPCVAFDCSEPFSDLPALQQQLQQALITAASQNSAPTRITMTLEGWCQVQLAHFPPMPCGGTHVESTAALRGLKIYGVKQKQGKLTIRYGDESAPLNRT